MTKDPIMNEVDLQNLFKQNLDNLHGWGISERAIKEIVKASKCRSDLGAEVYASESGEIRIVPHTCKSRACATCGALRTSVWAGEACKQVPDVPFASIIFTMRGSFWEIFRRNRSLLKALPEIGARVIEDWARVAYGADVAIIVAQHTFGARLNFNCHLHLIASRTGISQTGQQLVRDIVYPAEKLTLRWQQTVLALLSKAAMEGWIESDQSTATLLQSLAEEANTEWIKLVKNLKNVQQYLRYMGRYLRRPPITNSRLLPSPDGHVYFNYWQKLSRKVERLPGDVKTRFGTIKRLQTAKHSVKEFFELLADQIPDRYCHMVRYFGLLAPRSAARYKIFLQLLGKSLPPRRVGGQHWLYWILKRFGINPLVDSNGKPLRWLKSLSPAEFALFRLNRT